MRIALANLRAQYYELKELIDLAMVEVIESGQFINGEKVQRLESAIASACGARYGVGVASGTDALVLGLVACGIGPGDEVITTPFTFGATTEAIAHVGAKPVYVDIDLCTFNLDPDRIEDQITERTRAILPVDLFGQMADRQALTEIAHRHKLKLIVDSAQAIGAAQTRRHIASDGDVTTLSFYPTKNLGAYGDAGMALTNDPEIDALLRSVHTHGVGSDGAYGIYERLGYCSRLDTIQAVVLLAKLPELAQWNERRRRNAERYAALLGDLTEFGLTLPRCEPGNHHVYHQYTIRHAKRDELQDVLRRNGVESKIFYPVPMHLQPAYRHLGSGPGEFPAAEQACREVLSIPIHPELTEEDLLFVAKLIRDFVTA